MIYGGIDRIKELDQEERLKLLRKVGENLRSSESDNYDKMILDIGVLCWLETMRIAYPDKKPIKMFLRFTENLDNISSEMVAVVERCRTTEELINQFKELKESTRREELREELIQRGILSSKGRGGEKNVDHE